MQPASSTSRPLLTLWATAAQVLLVVLAAGWLLLALGWAVLHGWIVPRASEFRPQLQTLASKATGLRVDIGELRAHSAGVFPGFELKQVRLQGEGGGPGLLLPQVLVTLSPRSVLTGSLEQLVIRGAELDVRRTAGGQLLLAGLALSPDAAQNKTLADWLMSQREWALQNGQVRWTDEQHGVALSLTAVDAVMRHPGHQHLLRLDATPPPEWGERFSLQGSFTQPVLLSSASDWRQWSGQLYGQFSRVDAAPLQAYTRLAGLQIQRGVGALRAWVDVQEGRMVGGVADVALSHVSMTVPSDMHSAPPRPPLNLERLSTRLGWQERRSRAGLGLDLQTEALNLQLASGLGWTGGRLALKLDRNAPGPWSAGQLKADRLDLQVLAQLAQHLPQEGRWQQLLAQAPQGQVKALEGQWQGPLAAPKAWKLRGQLSGLALTADSQTGRPGMAGVNLDFRLQHEDGEDTGQASFSLNKGWLEFPGLWQEPRMDVDKLTGELRLKRNAGGTDIEWRHGQLVARDAQGQFKASWTRAAGDDPWGNLDLQGQLSRADGARVWRYLPEALPAKVRQYVRQSVQHAPLSEVRFKLKGPLAAFPFESPDSGEFEVLAQVRNGSYAYVPTQPDNSSPTQPWPSLTQVDADLHFQGVGLQVRGGQAHVNGLPGLQLSGVEARIAHLRQRPVVEVSGDMQGPLSQGLAWVHTSPVADMLQQALARSTASGQAELQLKLSLPLDALGNSKVQGRLTLPGNDVQITPETPALNHLRASVVFSETGFQTVNAQARVLGGELRFDGGLRAALRRQDEPELFFRGQGTASAQGLQQWRELQALQPWLRQASGSTSYNAALGWRQGALELSLTSELDGLALALPEPLNKPAAARLPLRLDKTVLHDTQPPGQRLQDRINLSLGPGAGLTPALSASYLRDISGPQAQVLGGRITLGRDRYNEATAPPSAPPSADRSERGVHLQASLGRLDLDAWQPWLDQWPASQPLSASSWTGYLPTRYTLRAEELKTQGHSMQTLALTGQREGGVWQARLSAAELQGQVEYRQSRDDSPGRLMARLSRLSLGQSGVSQVEALLDRQPASLPSLDLVVDELELRGKKLGRLEVEALNRQLSQGQSLREWQLSRLRLSAPEGQLNATGSWAALPGADGAAGRRGTQLAFKLEVADSGELLKRLGMDGAIRQGKGRLEGQLSWIGSPLALHHPSLQGQMVVDVASGQFLKADAGAAKLLGVLSLQALPRRLALDFRDVFSEGFAFDWLRGDVTISRGVATTSDLRMKGVNAAVLMQGSADMARETQDLRVVVVPEINAGTASLLAYAANPAMAVGTFLAQWLLRQPLNDANTQEFQVSGPWSEPQIRRVPRQRPPSGSSNHSERP
jgi:uncharacterized protein (TIGR02099 family)